MFRSLKTFITASSSSNYKYKYYSLSSPNDTNRISNYKYSTIKSFTMSQTELEALIEQRNNAGNIVRLLKESKSSAEELNNALANLQIIKEKIELLTAETKLVEDNKRKENIKFRADVEDLCKRRFIFTQSFEIYGGYGGLFDYGPIGATLKENFLTLWRRHFVLEEEMLEISTVCMTPEVVLKASGHVDRFTDLMVKDEKTGDCYRADKLVEGHIDTLLEDVALPTAQRNELSVIRGNVGAYNAEQMEAVFVKFGLKSEHGNAYGKPYAYNLMFGTSIGPTGKIPGFLRPETAQGIFTNFKRLLESNNNRMPFAAAQIGLAYRNEIAPRSGLLRVREFQMAEIEHFVNPNAKDHPRFSEVANVVLNLYSRDLQADGLERTIKLTVGEAVSTKVIDNETLGYYLARTHLFLLRVGIHSDKLRFRQHLSNEMAHYAKDCWDAEINTSYGWVECVGHADRSCYDLIQHSKFSGVELFAQEVYPQPIFEDTAKFDFNRGVLGKVFRKEQQLVTDYVKTFTLEQAKQMDATLKETGSFTVTLPDTGASFALTNEMVKISFTTEKISSRRYVPSVIEPSFGIGRILYSMIEHAFWTREKDEQRKVLSFSAIVAPIKCYVFPLSGNDAFTPFAKQVYRTLLNLGLTSKIDDSGAALGKRYSRVDEIGVPFAVTIDFQTVQDKTVTIRERDSTLQVRLPIDQVATLIQSLVYGDLEWKDAMNKFPKFDQQELN